MTAAYHKFPTLSTPHIHSVQSTYYMSGTGPSSENIEENKIVQSLAPVEYCCTYLELMQYQLWKHLLRVGNSSL